MRILSQLLPCSYMSKSLSSTMLYTLAIQIGAFFSKVLISSSCSRNPINLHFSNSIGCSSCYNPIICSFSWAFLSQVIWDILPLQLYALHLDNVVYWNPLLWVYICVSLCVYGITRKDIGVCLDVRVILLKRSVGVCERMSISTTNKK